MCYACKTSCARNIIGVIPYLPYSKQSKMKKRGCIVSKLVAKMLTRAGMTHLITMDLHQKEVSLIKNTFLTINNTIIQKDSRVFRHAS